MTNVIAIVAGAFVTLMVVMQVVVRLQARAMRGKPVPALGGRVGELVRRAQPALLYFHSPTCGACRAITPRMRELASKGSPVELVDVSQELDLARAFRVMATPSFVEVAAGKVVALHVGPPPADLLARFS